MNRLATASVHQVDDTAIARVTTQAFSFDCSAADSTITYVKGSLARSLVWADRAAKAQVLVCELCLLSTISKLDLKHGWRQHQVIGCLSCHVQLDAV